MPQLRSIWQNKLSELGAILAVLAILFFVSFQVVEALSPTSNPYTGLWTFMILPALMLVGLIIIPIGYLRERSRRRKLYPEVRDWPRLPHFDPNNPRHLRGLAVVSGGAMVVIPLIAVASYQGYHYTDSTQFCGQVCHSVMQPEHTSYLGSPHARVECAACHIGPGASWYVKSKISGVRQVLAVTFNTFSRPIPTPVRNLRPARETCEQCHWPAKFFGAQLRTRIHYASDEGNTRKELRVLVKTGGADPSMGRPSGIHWHMALSQKIEYVASDARRQVIPWVRSTDAKGQSEVYRSDGIKSLEPPPGEIRRVDCMDCHNRPTHIYQPPDNAVNIGLETGRIDPRLPYIKKYAVEALTVSYRSPAEADTGIDSYVRDSYKRLSPQQSSERKASIDKAVLEIRAIYHRNFFPSMKVDWRTYPNNIGHMIFDGCFRCHDGKHVREDNSAIRKDCTVCHEFQRETASAGGGSTFQQAVPEHPYKLEGVHALTNCSNCHTGGRAPVPTCEGCHTSQSQFRAGIGPALPGLQPTKPAVMADLSCDSCHDLSKGPSAKVTEQCETCHEKGYGDMVEMWLSDARSAREKANAAIQDLQKGLPNHPRLRNARQQSLQELSERLQAALDAVDRAGPQHNTDLADKVYQQIAKLAGDAKK